MMARLRMSLTIGAWEDESDMNHVILVHLYALIHIGAGGCWPTAPSRMAVAVIGIRVPVQVYWS